VLTKRLSEFDARVQRYAALLIRVAVNLQRGQRLTIWKAPVNAAPFVRSLTEEAYEAGAAYVDVFWQDDRLELIRLTHTLPDTYADRPAWEVEVMESSAQDGGAFLFFDCTCAGVFDNTPAAVVSRAIALENEHLQRVWQFFVRNTVNWSIATVPTESWARKVYPALEPADGIRRLWEAIFTTCRVDTEDYEARWFRHRKALEQRSDALNRLSLTELRFTALGTDLTVGLPPNHTWQHPGFHTTQGLPFIADIPIEEIFTVPDRDRVDGVVRSTRPLVVNGQTLSDFTVRLERGRIVEITGDDRAQRLLTHLLENNDGADRLGEVAIVPEDSLVAMQGHSFYNTIFDENSSCHLAIGRAYRFCMAGGKEMDDPAFVAAGGNVSPVHVDFMIGSREMSVTGVTTDGTVVSILEAGQWVLDRE